MRLIDADNLNFEGQKYSKMQLKAILEFVDAQPTVVEGDFATDIDAGSKGWIPCNERLPEANTRMKVWVTIIYPSGRHTRKVLWNGWCFEWSNGKYIDTSLDKIVAWKPYHGPEPWRGDADAKEK